MPITDYESFIAGVQVGRRLKLWDAMRKFIPPVWERAIATEDYLIITTEDDKDLYPEV